MALDQPHDLLLLMQNPIIIVMIQKYTLFLLLLGLTPVLSIIEFNLTEQNKNGGTFENSECNKDTIIDFKLSAASQISRCAPQCNIQNEQQSSVYFLDVQGNERQYTLTKVIVSTDLLQITGNTVPSFVFTFTNANRTVEVCMPLTEDNITGIGVLNVSLLSDSFTGIKEIDDDSINGGGDITMSAFNVFNLRDFGLFYHVSNDDRLKTVLLSRWSYVLGSNIAASITPTTDIAFTADYGGTGDLLCYGSTSQGIFQTHIRESYPLWTAWIAVLLFWLYNLLTEENELNCYDRQFENNKWTCWGFYSLHYLGNLEFFSKLARSTVLLLSFSWQACILAAIYGTRGDQFGDELIAWSALVALVGSLPLPYLFGCITLSPMYEHTVRKYGILKKMKGVFKKQSLESYETQVDEVQQHIYAHYYWFYIISAALFIVFWTISVYAMQMTARKEYHLHQYWLASLGICFVLDNLILDPLMSFISGGFTFYQKRGGFYYNYALGETYKQIQD